MPSLHQLIMKVNMRPSFSGVSAGKLLFEPHMSHTDTHIHTDLCNTYLHTCKYGSPSYTRYKCLHARTLPVTQSQLSTAAPLFDVSMAIQAEEVVSQHHSYPTFDFCLFLCLSQFPSLFVCLSLTPCLSLSHPLFISVSLLVYFSLTTCLTLSVSNVKLPIFLSVSVSFPSLSLSLMDFRNASWISVIKTSPQ